jgi:hypothetical protein
MSATVRTCARALSAGANTAALFDRHAVVRYWVQVLSNGLQVSFMGFFTGTVDLSHLSMPASAYWAQHYNKKDAYVTLALSPPPKHTRTGPVHLLHIHTLAHTRNCLQRTLTDTFIIIELGNHIHPHTRDTSLTRVLTLGAVAG